MASLQRSSNTFRREGSSGLVWDDNLLIEQMPEKGDYGELRHCQSTTQGIRIVGPNEVRVMDIGGGSNGASSSYLPRSSSASVANIRSKKVFGFGFRGVTGKPPSAVYGNKNHAIQIHK
ncbi:uncharacterized protein LOC131318175 [Rhododendron vialii]|uniref:uncharacterized protein LOC131318175 n=1 Tax=Rhododendron vialii TaxID=182163 RepID=UPI00265E4991|nr:uncharacterized protein LOC131318175 [Rhododendron vialii]